MRQILIVFCAVLVSVSFTSTAHGQIVISEVYGGGGNSGANYNQDFVELYNNGSSAQSLAGWTLQYASNTGTFNGIINLSGTLAAGEVGMVRLATGSNGTALPNNAQVLATNTGINISATAGKVALANTNTTVTGPTAANVVDFVGYGATASQSEGGSPAPGPGTVISIIRKANAAGTALQDTNNNSADFVLSGANQQTPGVAAVPEPGSLILVGASCLTALAFKRFRRPAKANDVTPPV